MQRSKITKLCKQSKNLNVLYVEDDLELQKKTSVMLSNIFTNIDCCSNGKEALEQYKNFYANKDRYYNIVITDIKMPIMDGINLSKHIKHINDKQIIVVTSAHDESKYLIKFIDIGIKKFIKKPFTFENIINVFSSICDDIYGNDEIIVISDELSWNQSKSKLFDNGIEVKLSNNEFQILKLLISNPNQTFSADDLYYVIDIDNFEKEISYDAIKSSIKRLRKKLSSETIENIYGKGYRINM